MSADCNGKDVPASLRKGPAAVAKRTAAALATAATVSVLFFYAPIGWFPPVLALLATFCQAEFCGMVRNRIPRVSVARGCAGALLSFAFAAYFAEWMPMEPEVAVLAGPAAAAAFIALTASFKGKTVAFAALAECAGILYICVPVGFFMLLALCDGCICAGPRYGAHLLFFVLATVKASDMGGYAFGKAFGKHKLCPSISPSKSWEGLFGGMFASALVACIFCACAANFKQPEGSCHPLFWDWLTYPRAVAAGVAACLLGTASDLFESKIKRVCGVKDSSVFLPAGMGGFLDMFDSIMFAPAAFRFFTAYMGF